MHLPRTIILHIIAMVFAIQHTHSIILISSSVYTQTATETPHIITQNTNHSSSISGLAPVLLLLATRLKQKSQESLKNKQKSGVSIWTAARKIFSSISSNLLASSYYFETYWWDRDNVWSSSGIHFFTCSVLYEFPTSCTYY